MTDMAEQLIALQRSDEMDALREASIALAAENAALKARKVNVRNDTLREAADKVREWQAFTKYAQEPIAEEMAQDVLALIDTPAAVREVTVQEAWTVEDVTDHLEDVIGETHDIDVTDRNYAENVVQYLRRHPAALRALAGDDQ